MVYYHVAKIFYLKEFEISLFLLINHNFSKAKLSIQSKHFNILFRSALFQCLRLVPMFFMPNLACISVLWALLKMLHTFRLCSQRRGTGWHHWQLGLFGYFMYRYLHRSQMPINEKRDLQNFPPVIPLHSLKRFSQASAKNFGTHFLDVFFFYYLFIYLFSFFINHSFQSSLMSEMHIRILFKISNQNISKETVTVMNSLFGK